MKRFLCGVAVAGVAVSYAQKRMASDLADALSLIAASTAANLNDNYTGTGTGQVRGIVVSSGVNTISQNTIRNLSNTGTTTGSG